MEINIEINAEVSENEAKMKEILSENENLSQMKHSNDKVIKKIGSFID